MSKYLLSIDQGTTSSRAIVYDTEGKNVSVAQKEFTQIYPQPGWVEHNAKEIWETQLEVTKQALQKIGAGAKEIISIGVTNQRETVVIWDKHSGEPVYNAIVWQDKRTSGRCNEIKNAGKANLIKEKTGLVVDSYFSATKIEWILNRDKKLRQKAVAGELLAGTIDSWLIWNFTGGSVHATDVSNASRTMLFNLNTLKWDEELLELFDIPEKMLPEVKMSADDYGKTLPGLLGGSSIPINGVAGDQQSALFGQACFKAGMAKNTYGTGCFMLMNTGDKKVVSDNGLLTTIAWGLDDKITYALEGSIFIAGAAVQWLRDEMKLIKHAAESEKLAAMVEDTNGVYMVPAFTGLGAPYWDMDAKGAILGLTRGANEKHIIRATLESIAYQTRDVLDTMNAESGIKLQSLRVDGGATANHFLMQFQADMLNTPVERPSNIEATAWGAALLAGVYHKVFSLDSISKVKNDLQIFSPGMKASKREELYDGWKLAVKMVMGK